MVEENGSRTIYLVEDDPGDVLLVEEALREQCSDCRLEVFDQAEPVWDHLRSGGAPPPDLILLDMNMPGMGGREFLRTLKTDPRFSEIPVVMLTTSTRGEDILQCYRDHANAYLSKGDDLERFFAKVKALLDFWFGAAELPHTQEAGRRLAH